MSFELAPGTLLNNRYQIKKVIAFKETGGVYLARDLKVTDKNWIVKELIPAASLDDETLAARRALFTEAVESAMQFEQPALPKILDAFTEARREYVVMENVEGATLQKLSDMSVTALPEKQVLTWGLQICDALIYLHNRPKPFIFNALSPEHIILTLDEKIKLINFGLDRFFGETPPPKVFAEDPNDILREFVSFGETICLLLTKEKPGPYGVPQGANVSPESTKVLNRTLQGEAQKTYSNFEDVKRDLELALNPPAQPKKESTTTGKKRIVSARASGAPSPVAEAFNRVAVAILSQRPAFLFSEIAVLFFLVIGTWFVLNPGVSYTKTGEIAYLGVGSNGFTAINSSTHDIVDKQALMNATFADLLVVDKWLYISDSGGQRLLRFNTDTDQMPEKFAAIPVDRSPSRMVVDSRGHYIFVLNAATHNVSRVNLQHEPPQMDAIITVGESPKDIALSNKGDLLYVANGKDRTVSIVDTDTNKSKGSVDVGGTPVGLVAAPDLTAPGQVWVFVEDPDSIVIVDAQAQQVKQTITDLAGGTGPTSGVFSPDGTQLFVTMTTPSEVMTFDTATAKAGKPIVTGDHPRRLIFNPSQTQLWAICSGGSQSGVTVIDPSSDRVMSHIDLPNASGTAAMAP